MIEYNGERIISMGYAPNYSVFVEEIMYCDCRYKIYEGYDDENDEDFLFAVLDTDNYEERKFSYNE